MLKVVTPPAKSFGDSHYGRAPTFLQLDILDRVSRRRLSAIGSLKTKKVQTGQNRPIAGSGARHAKKAR